jgi:hypothetical protein
MPATHFIQDGSEKWQIRKQDREKVQQRKHLIQEKFRKEMGLLVDVPKPGGNGTTNDGNTAKRFFRDPTLSASITGIDETLIRKCSVTLQALSSGYRVNATAFDNYAKETAKLFVSLCAWYYMPASVHKALIHESAIVSAALLPIGQLSEEAQEARNKDIKKIQRTLYKKVIEIIDQFGFNAKADVNVGSCDLFIKGTTEEIKRITSSSSHCPLRGSTFTNVWCKCKYFSNCDKSQ